MPQRGKRQRQGEEVHRTWTWSRRCPCPPPNNVKKSLKSTKKTNEVKDTEEDQNADQELLDLDLGQDSDIFAEQAERETDKVKMIINKNNNNNKNKIPTRDHTPNKKKQKIKSPDKSPDKRKTCFFTSPNSRKANSAAAEDHERQLNVHGLPNEFMGCTAGGVQDHALYQLFLKLSRRKAGQYGIDIKQYHIVGARPVIQSSSNSEDLVMRVTLDSKDTKERIISAATSANLWGFKDKDTAFFRDIPPEKKVHTEDRERPDKRKREQSQLDSNMSKRAKTDKDPSKQSRNKRGSGSN